MFDGAYINWNHARVKAIIDFYGPKTFYWKSLLELGSGIGDISIAFSRLGADVTAVEARQEHVDILKKKYSNLKIQKVDLDNEWPFSRKRFDFVIDMGLLCHLKNWKNHLAQVCSVATFLVLETEVCDSDDPEKILIVEESKAVYDWSFNGVGSRPSAAAIERELTNNGFSFKRHDSPKLNSGPYKYDWTVQNTGDRKFGLRRMWFARKTGQPIVENKSLLKETMNLKVDLIIPDIQPKKEFIPVPNKSVEKLYPHKNTNNSVSEDYRNLSKEFSILVPEKFAAPISFNLSATILPMTSSARNWFKKVYNFFPNLKVSSKSITMNNFNRSLSDPDLVISSIHTVYPAKRIWIEEWNNVAIHPDTVSALRKCEAILTPSLVNAQEILTLLPEANIIRCSRPWPLLNAIAFSDDYFLYFEKDSNITQLLLNSWDNSFGKLYIVGSGIKLPNFAEYVSDCLDYPSLMSKIFGAKAIIDLNNNNYYMSGILSLAKSIGIPILTNNNQFSSEYSISALNAINIKASLSKFIKTRRKLIPKYNENYNNILLDNLNIMLGK